MTGFAPPVEAVHARRVRAIARRNICPRRARPQSPEYPVQNPPVIDPRNRANRGRQQRLDH